MNSPERGLMPVREEGVGGSGGEEISFGLCVVLLVEVIRWWIYGSINLSTHGM